MYQAIKGTRDILFEDAKLFTKAENLARKILELYNYSEIRIPIFEATDVFARGIGDDTDIVTKEMYTFQSKSGKSITLRPEGTAGIVRAIIEHNLLKQNPVLKLYYIGPMFRYERPQAGRYRQFYSIGWETFGVMHPAMDAETISIIITYLEKLGLKDLRVSLNSIGCEKCRPNFNKTLIDFLKKRISKSCDVCKDRLSKNPLRVLDCKEKDCIENYVGAPKPIDFLCEECTAHFEKLKSYLKSLKIQYVINHKLVRGLDYYTKTVFEINCPELGAQDAIVGGGRYDHLVETLGGPFTPAVGASFGLDRVLATVKLAEEKKAKKIAEEIDYLKAITLFAIDDNASDFILSISDILAKNNIKVIPYYDKRSVKSGLRVANTNKTLLAGFLGEDELKKGIICIKNMKDGNQIEVKIKDITNKVIDLLK